MIESFKNLVLKEIQIIMSEKNIEYSINDYQAESDDGEIMNLTDIIIRENINIITLSNDFALVVIEGQQYDFEEYRYKNNNELINDFKSLLSNKL